MQYWPPATDTNVNATLLRVTAVDSVPLVRALVPAAGLALGLSDTHLRHVMTFIPSRQSKVYCHLSFIDTFSISFSSSCCICKFSILESVANLYNIMFLYAFMYVTLSEAISNI